MGQKMKEIEVLSLKLKRRDCKELKEKNVELSSL